MPVGAAAAGPAPGADAFLALPLVGAVVGALGGTLGLLAGRLAPHAVAAALALAATIVLTGAIHLDGFLDGCDGFFAPVSPERRREILKDPRHGTFAVVGMWIVGSLAFAALAAIAPDDYPAVLAFAGALARLAAIANAYVVPTAAAGTAARALQTRPKRWPVIAQALVLVAFAAWQAPAFALSVPVALALGLALGATLARRLGGGLVGDAYGFIIVVVEVGVVVLRSAAGAYFR